MGVKKGLLPFTGIGPHEAFGRIPGTLPKSLMLVDLPPMIPAPRAPVHFGFPAPFPIQRKEGLGHIQPQAHLGSAGIMKGGWR